MRGLLIIITCICLAAFSAPREPDYKKVFGDKYSWAVNWLNQNDSLIHEFACAFNIPEKELKAIVFPELIRYNRVFNAIEIESLKYLYVSEGKEYADFSVGYFQMKPSFGEMIEKDAFDLLPKAYQATSGWTARLANAEESRRERVKRLTNVSHQLIYLCAFYKVCDNRFRSHKFASSDERLKLFATCYNAGYKRSNEALLAFSKKSNFYGYNYSEISAYYFQHE